MKIATYDIKGILQQHNKYKGRYSWAKMNRIETDFDMGF